MKKRFIDAGKIVNTHGIRGELRIQPWCDSAEFLKKFKTLYIDGQAMKVTSSRLHKSFLLVTLDGIEDINAAMPYKNKVVQIDRHDARLPQGSHFIVDLVGLDVRNAETGKSIGCIAEVLNLPANDVYVVKGEHEYMIPVVSAFIAETNVDEGYVLVNMQEGLATDEN